MVVGGLYGDKNNEYVQVGSVVVCTSRRLHSPQVIKYFGVYVGFGVFLELPAPPFKHVFVSPLEQLLLDPANAVVRTPQTSSASRCCGS